MSDETMITNCSPTLAALKTGNLFGSHFNNKVEMLECVSNYNAKLVPKGVRMIPMKYENGRALLYVYRPDRLAADLKNVKARKILKRNSYPYNNADKCVLELINRLANQEAFPHEIGLFLGYPPEDVEGFIKYGAKNAKYVGTWKVYGDVSKAKKKFLLYQKCTGAYRTAYNNHKSFDRLIVSLNNNKKEGN